MKIDLILSEVSVRPLSTYLDLPSEIDLEITTLSLSLKIGSDLDLLLLSNTRVTMAFVIPAFPRLYISSCKFVTLTCDKD